MKVYLILIFILTVSSLFGQTRRMSFSDFINEANQPSNSVYKLSDVEIYNDKPSQDWFSISEGRIRFEKKLNDPKIKISIERPIELTDVIFSDKRVTFNNIIFKKDVILANPGGRNIVFKNCEFKNKIIFNNYQQLDVSDCKFDSEAIFSDGQIRTQITRCTFGNKKKSGYRSQASFDGSSDGHSVIISGSQFYGDSLSPGLNFFLRFSEISIKYCSFETPVNFSYIFVRDKFAISNCNFKKSIVFATVKFPIENSSVTWPDLRGKIAIAPDSITRVDNHNHTYSAKTDEELGQVENYNELISTYSKFIQIFKFRNSSEWYNECYVEMKNIMTRKAGYEYKRNKNLKNFLDWKIKLFLKDFSDYGTDYTKSIIYALKVVLLFAIVFFLFPSEKDILSRENIFIFFERSVEYFKTEKNLISLYEAKKENELQTLKSFRFFLIKSKRSSPKIISCLAWPTYRFDLYINSLVLWMLKKIELHRGKWEDLSTKRKRLFNVLAAVFFLGYIIYGILLRALNAFALSLNSLTTLGYGGFTARGIARYLVVIEGLIGWFLLTIFSVSLIGQIL